MSKKKEELQRQYAQALLANRKAQSQLEKLANESLRSTKTDHARPTGVLSSHLEVVRIREENRQLRVLSHYMEEAGSIADESQIWNVQYQNTRLDNENLATTVDTTALFDNIKELVRRLEIAVLQAQHVLQRGQSKLEEIRAMQRQTTSATTRTKLNALSATRAKLTQWIEISLEKCDGEDATLHGLHEEMIKSPEDLQPVIGSNYAEYLAARRRLLQALHSLNTPNVFDDDLPTKLTSVERDSSSQPTPFTSALCSIEAQHLQLLRQDKHLRQHEDHLRDQIDREKDMEREHLYRFSDESHLLPSYPMLAHSERFKHATAAFREPEQDILADKVSRLMKAWIFAAEAAEINITEAVSRQCEQGDTAVQETRARIEAIKGLHNSWKHL